MRKQFYLLNFVIIIVESFDKYVKLIHDIVIEDLLKTLSVLFLTRFLTYLETC